MTTLYGLTLTEMANATGQGYTGTVDSHRGWRFEKNNRFVWAVYSGWQTADLIKGHYTNHKLFDNITDAVNREL